MLHESIWACDLFTFINIKRYKVDRCLFHMHTGYICFLQQRLILKRFYLWPYNFRKTNLKHCIFFQNTYICTRGGNFNNLNIQIQTQCSIITQVQEVYWPFFFLFFDNSLLYNQKTSHANCWLFACTQHTCTIFCPQLDVFMLKRLEF